MSHSFHLIPKGPFELANQNGFFGGWDVLEKDHNALVMAFPVEGWKGSAAVVVRQTESSDILGEVYASEDCAEQAERQALAALSLDVDASAWPAVGERDSHIKPLQEKYGYVRPELFHSPYEAAAHFIIGHRISINQARGIRKKMAEDLGDKIIVADHPYAAFPSPQVIINLKSYPSLNQTKIDRLHGIAHAALDGWLDRQYLRQMPIPDALAKLETLAGVGPFFSQGILHRGAGIVDDITDDDISKYGIEHLYHLSHTPTYAEVLQVAEKWRPFRMWASVLIHIWVRRELGMPHTRTFSGKK